MEEIRDLRPGMELVMTKWCALAGTAFLAEKEEEMLRESLPKNLIRTAQQFTQYSSVEAETKAAEEFGAAAIEPVTESGIFAALWHLIRGSECHGVGLEVDLRKIPIRQETVEICERVDVNPYNLLSDGSLLIAAGNGYALVSELAARQIPATVIGRITKGNDKVILNVENKRYLDRPQTEELCRLYGEGWRTLCVNRF